MLKSSLLEKHTKSSSVYSSATWRHATNRGSQKRVGFYVLCEVTIMASNPCQTIYNEVIRWFLNSVHILCIIELLCILFHNQHLANNTDQVISSNFKRDSKLVEGKL